MNPQSFTDSITIEDLESFIEEQKKVFNVMHVDNVERVELAAYQQKNVARTWFDQWKEGRYENHNIRVGPVLKSFSWAFLSLKN